MSNLVLVVEAEYSLSLFIVVLIVSVHLRRFINQEIFLYDLSSLELLLQPSTV